MSAPKKDAPRRYIVDGAGKRVLVGLTISETVEFESLDRVELDRGALHPDADLPGRQLCVHRDKHDERWLELYAKHEQAWSDWMAETRDRLKPHVLN
jgi:hypothetical protein